MLYIIVVVIAIAIIWWYRSDRAMSRNEKQYLRRRGYDDGEPVADGPPVSRESRLYGLIESLGDLSPFARHRAAEELSRMCEKGQGDARMLPALLASLNDRDPSVRGAVATALGNLGDCQAIERLNERLGEEESIHVKAALSKALEKLASKSQVNQQS